LEELKQKLEQQPIQQQAQAVANTPPPSEVDIKALSEQHADAILEGDSHKAAELQAQIIQAAITSAKSGTEAPDTAAMVQQAVQQVELTRTAEELQNVYPQLDKDGDTFDAELNDKVFKFYEGLVLGGTPPAAALAEAADTVMAAAGVTTAGTPGATNRGISKKVDAAAATPPALTPAVGGTNTTTLPTLEDVSNMSAEEWDALPESTRQKLMGIS